MKKSATKKQRNSIKAGDIFRIGDHILGCGDARDIDFIDRVIGKAKVALLVTDPPYGVEFVESKEGFSNIKVKKKILNDGIVSELQYAEFTVAWLAPLLPHFAKKNAVYIFNSDKMLFALRDAMADAGIRFAQLLIWVKNHAVVGRKDYLPQHELVAYGWYGTHEFKKAKDKSILLYPKPGKSPLHPTQKPVGLLRRLILNSSDIGDIVYDCFAGSGSTGIAAEQCMRKSILIERDEEYCQTIIDRFERQFGLVAEKL